MLRNEIEFNNKTILEFYVIRYTHMHTDQYALAVFSFLPMWNIPINIVDKTNLMLDTDICVNNTIYTLPRMSTLLFLLSRNYSEEACAMNR